MNREPERNQRKALGKGLSALLPTRSYKPSEFEAAVAPGSQKTPLPEQFEEFQSIPLEMIGPGTEQPRDSFDGDKLQELSQSIRANGVIQPITVYRSEPGKYRIIAGERRWRAAQIAGLKEIPALIRQVQHEQLLELGLVENIQREDLNPIEIATAFQRLAIDHRLSHEEIAEKTGKDRSTVTNFLRLLKLSPFVKQALSNGSISVGHARALLNITSDGLQLQVCDEIIAKQLSVRETEKLVKTLTTAKQEQEKGAEAQPVDPNIRAALDEMAAALGTRVRLVSKPGASSGRLEIEYYSQDDLDRIYSVIAK